LHLKPPLLCHAPALQARNRQAMNEIRKVINWAQQPPVLTGNPAVTQAAAERHSSGSGSNSGSTTTTTRAPSGQQIPSPASWENSASHSRAGSPDDVGHHLQAEDSFSSEVLDMGGSVMVHEASMAEGQEGSHHGKQLSSALVDGPLASGLRAASTCVPLLLNNEADTQLLSSDVSARSSPCRGGKGSTSFKPSDGDGEVVLTLNRNSHKHAAVNDAPAGQGQDCGLEEQLKRQQQQHSGSSGLAGDAMITDDTLSSLCSDSSR
jgi:hypothetical protein